MPAESPFASAAELPTCTSDASPVSSSSSAGPTRANTPDLEQHPDLRAVSDREEDVLFFGGAEILDNDNDNDGEEEGPSVPSSSERGGAVQGPLTIMETLVRVERASEVAEAVVEDSAQLEMADGGQRARVVARRVKWALVYKVTVLFLAVAGTALCVGLLVGAWT